MVCAIFQIGGVGVVAKTEPSHVFIGVREVCAFGQSAVEGQKINQSLGIAQGKAGHRGFRFAELSGFSTAKGTGVECDTVAGPGKLDEKNEPVPRCKGQVDAPIELVRELFGLVQKQDRLQFPL